MRQRGRTGRRWLMVVALSASLVTAGVGLSLMLKALAQGVNTAQVGQSADSTRISLIPPTSRGLIPSPGGVSLRGVDGGVGYYSKFTNGLPNSASYFPIGVWFESTLDTTDVAKDKAAGLNTYVELTSDSNLAPIAAAGMHAIPGWASSGSAFAGQLTTDEADMWAGPGNATWTGKYPGEGDVCSPAGAQCGYTIMQKLAGQITPGIMKYTNYGKGVTFWESDAQAAQFINKYQDLVSADNYWFTDPNICGSSEGGSMLGNDKTLTAAQCRLASNYGATTDRLRALVSPAASKPTWSFVELGHPFTEDDAPTITGPQIRAAVWSSLIHGARGVIYFNHNFGGSCISQHVLRDSCGASIRPTVTAVNQQITRLAPVLNAPFVDGLASSTGKVDIATKIYQGQFYLLAGSAQQGAQSTTISLKCGAGTTATVIDENRTITMKNGTLTDTFADGNAVHLYKINGGNTCGLA